MAGKKKMAPSDAPVVVEGRGETSLELPEMPERKPGLEKSLRERLRKALEKARDEEEFRAGALRALAEYCRKEKARILGRDKAKLDRFRADRNQSRAKHGSWYPRQRQARTTELVRYAEELGVNTDELFHLNAYARTTASQLMGGGAYQPFNPGYPGPSKNSFDQNCASREPPSAVGTFETSYQVYSAGQVLEMTSYFEPSIAQSGGAVRFRNWDADDYDTATVYMENGFTACYTTGDKPGLIKITATYQAVDSHMSLTTYDEWGWSECDIGVAAFATFAVYLVEPGDLQPIESSNTALASWFYRGDGEPDNNDLPGNQPYHPPTGTEITLSSIFPVIAPASSIVGIYAGTRHIVNFFSNDVSIDGRAAGKWLVKRIEMCQVEASA